MTPAAATRADTGLAATLLEAAEFQASLAGAIAAGSTQFGPGEKIVCARRARVLGQAIVTGAVYAELAEGRSWAQVAGALGVDEMFARDIYQDGYQAWLAGEPASILPGLPAHLSPPAPRRRLTARQAIARIGGLRAAIRAR